MTNLINQLLTTVIERIAGFNVRQAFGLHSPSLVFSVIISARSSALAAGVCAERSFTIEQAMNIILLNE